MPGLRLYIFIFFTTIYSCSKHEKSCNYISDYHPLVIKAEIAYAQKKYNEAYELLNKAFVSCKPRNTKTYYEIDKMAKITAKLGLLDESIEMVKLQIREGFTINKYLNDTIFDKVFKSKQGIKLISQYDSLHSNYLKSVDKSLVEKLIKMSACDQQYRKNGQYREHKQEQEKLDSINESQLVEIFESYGYPGEHLIRYSYPEMIRVDAILLHTEDSIRKNYFLPKLKKFVETGQCDPKTYAEVFDQYLLYNGYPQKYGTYLKQDGSLSNSVHLNEVNKNRVSIGLPTLEDKELIHQLKIVNYPDTYGRFFTTKN